jgi:hypothetical protein
MTGMVTSAQTELLIASYVNSQIYLYITYLTMLSALDDKKIVNNNSERMWKEAVLAYFKLWEFPVFA